MTTVAQLFEDSIKYKVLFLMYIIPILREKDAIQYSDSYETLLHVLEQSEIVEYIRSHPKYREYRGIHVEYLKQLENEYPDPNSLGIYNHFDKHPTSSR